MNSKIVGILFVIGVTCTTIIADDDAHVAGYAEQLVECFQECLEKYGKNGYEKSYPEKGNECKLSCKDKYSAEYGSADFYPEKQAECKQHCDEHYGKHGTEVTYPEKRMECHQRCGELYGYRKPVSE